MKLGFLTACLPKLSLEQIADWAVQEEYESLEVAAWPDLGERPFIATHIDAENNEKYFVHVSGLKEPISEGDKVTYELERGMKGMNAVRVSHI